MWLSVTVKLVHSSWAGFALLLLPQVWKCLLKSSQGDARLELGAEKFCQVQCWTHVSGPTLPTLCGTVLHHTRRTFCSVFWLPCAAFQHRHALSVCVTEENSLDIVGLIPVKKKIKNTVFPRGLLPTSGCRMQSDFVMNYHKPHPSHQVIWSSE